MNIQKFSDLINYNIYKTKNFIFNSKNYSYIYLKKKKLFYINIIILYKLLKIAKKAIQKISFKKGKFLFVDIKNENELLINYIQNSKNYYINNNWYGGLLTNWSTLKLKIQDIKILEKKLIDFNYKLTKKEIYTFKKKINLFNNSLLGIKNMKFLPDMIIFFNYENNLIGINECYKLGIPFICFFKNNNINLNLLLYPIQDIFYINKSYLYIINFLLNSTIF
jgi:small subunit ribosomal protein S2